LIAEEHPARAIWELVGRLDLSAFYLAIASSAEEGGRPAIDPQLLISCVGVTRTARHRSAREVARRCEVRSGLSVADGIGEVILSHAGGFSGGEAERVGRTVHASSGGAQQGRADHAGTSCMGRMAPRSKHWRAAELSPGRNVREHLERARQRVTEMGDPRNEEASAKTRQARARARQEQQQRWKARCRSWRNCRRKKSGEKGQEADAGEQQRSAGQGDAPVRWGLALSYNGADFRGCGRTG